MKHFKWLILTVAILLLITGCRPIPSEIVRSPEPTLQITDIPETIHSPEPILKITDMPVTSGPSKPPITNNEKPLPYTLPHEIQELKLAFTEEYEHKVSIDAIVHTPLTDSLPMPEGDFIEHLSDEMLQELLPLFFDDPTAVSPLEGELRERYLPDDRVLVGEDKFLYSPLSSQFGRLLFSLSYYTSDKNIGDGDPSQEGASLIYEMIHGVFEDVDFWPEVIHVIPDGLNTRLRFLQCIDGLPVSLTAEGLDSGYAVYAAEGDIYTKDYTHTSTLETKIHKKGNLGGISIRDVFHVTGVYSENNKLAHLDTIINFINQEGIIRSFNILNTGDLSHSMLITEIRMVYHPINIGNKTILKPYWEMAYYTDAGETRNLHLFSALEEEYR